MEDFLKKYGRNTVIISILLMFLSLFLIFKPLAFINFIMIALGCVILVNGISHMVNYFTTKSELRFFSFELLYGVISVIAGIFFIINPDWISKLLPFIIGIWIIVESTINIQVSLTMKQLIEKKAWIRSIITSIFTILLGIFILIHPLVSASILMTVCGMVLFVFELINIIEYIYFRIILK